MSDAKAKVNKALEQVEKEIQNLKEAIKPISPDNAIGRLSRMEAINEKSVNEASVRNLENRILRLKQALKRIDDDEYGECLKCGEEISVKRLNVIPEATLCLNCASDQ